MDTNDEAVWVGILFSSKNLSVIFIGDVQKSKCKFIFNKKNKIEFFGGHIWASHVIPGGTLATAGPPSFRDISYLAGAAGLVNITQQDELSIRYSFGELNAHIYC